MTISRIHTQDSLTDTFEQILTDIPYAEEDGLARALFRAAVFLIQHDVEPDIEPLISALGAWARENNLDSSDVTDEFIVQLEKAQDPSANPMWRVRDLLDASPCRVPNGHTQRQRDLATACYYLAEGTEDGYFFLGIRGAANIIDAASPATGGTTLKALVALGVIQEEARGGICPETGDRLATVYRYVGDREPRRKRPKKRKSITFPSSHLSSLNLHKSTIYDQPQPLASGSARNIKDSTKKNSKTSKSPMPDAQFRSALKQALATLEERSASGEEKREELANLFARYLEMPSSLFLTAFDTHDFRYIRDVACQMLKDIALGTCTHEEAMEWFSDRGRTPKNRTERGNPPSSAPLKN